MRRIVPGDRVLIIRAGALGDTIVTLPVARAIRLALGERGRVEWVGYRTPLRLALNSRHVQAAHSVDRALFSGLFSASSALDDLKGFLRQFDAIVAWCRDDTGHLGRVLDASAPGWIRQDPFPEPGSGVHITDYMLQMLDAFEVEVPSATPEIVLTGEAVSSSRRFLKSSGLAGRRVLAIHPGSGSRAKNWPARHFAELAGRATELGVGVLVVEGEADRDSVLEVQSLLPVTGPVASHLDLLTLAAILGSCRAYVGNDSGVTHLAAATGVPCVALVGPTSPPVWAPRGRQVVVEQLDSSADRVWSILKPSLSRRSLARKQQ